MLRRAVLCAGLVLLASATPAGAAPENTHGPDGTTAPVFDYEQAIRERVYIPQPGIDQDGDGVNDFLSIRARVSERARWPRPSECWQ